LGRQLAADREVQRRLRRDLDRSRPLGGRPRGGGAQPAVLPRSRVVVRLVRLPLPAPPGPRPPAPPAPTRPPDADPARRRRARPPAAGARLRPLGRGEPGIRGRHGGEGT
jgi:hypothetical protein